MSFVRTDKILPLTIFLVAKMLIPAQSVKINLILKRSSVYSWIYGEETQAYNTKKSGENRELFTNLWKGAFVSTQRNCCQYATKLKYKLFPKAIITL